MKICKELLAIFLSATSALGSSTIDQLKFIQIDGAPQGISLNLISVGSSNAFTLGPGGSVSRIGLIPGGLQFGIEKSAVITNIVGPRSISSTPDSEYLFVGGEAGALAVGRVSKSEVVWEKVAVKTSNPLYRVAVLGSNIVASTGGRAAFYAPTNDLRSFLASSIQGGTILESYVNLVGFSGGAGAIVGNSGVIRYTGNSGATFVYARPFGSSSVAVTDAAMLGGKLYATTEDGSVLSSDVPSDLSKSPVGWNWQSVNVSGQRALRGIASYGEQLIVVGDGGAAFQLQGTNWTALSNLPTSAKSADLITVKTATAGEFEGSVLISSKSTVYLGTPVPKPALLNIAKLETCSSNTIPTEKTFEAKPASGAKFVQIDWLLNGQRYSTNQQSFALFENRTGNFKYQAIVRDYRSGVESEPVDVTHEVFQNPAAPVALQKVYEQCASDPIVTLAVTPVEGVHFEWYNSTGALLTNGVSTNGLTFTPTLKESGTYFVEAVAIHDASECRSVDRTPVELKIHPLPDAPMIASTNLSVASCEKLPLLEVHPVAGVKFAWYTDATGGVLVSTNATFMPTASETSTYYVEAISEVTGCRSDSRTPVTLQVRPAFKLAAKDVVVRYGDTNTSVVLKVDITPSYESYHKSTWRSSGDGKFADANSFSTTYVPGTNDLAGGIVKVNLEVADSLVVSGAGLLCAADTAEFRIIYAQAMPSLKISVDEKGAVAITWPPAPGYKLTSSSSISFTNPKVVSEGEAGSLTISPEEGDRFYRLVPQ